jgi:hypothetical protein
MGAGAKNSDTLHATYGNPQGAVAKINTPIRASYVEGNQGAAKNSATLPATYGGNQRKFVLSSARRSMTGTKITDPYPHLIEEEDWFLRTFPKADGAIE